MSGSVERLLAGYECFTGIVPSETYSDEIAKRAVSSLESRQVGLYYTSQNILEFWSVSTRPIDVNGFGFSIVQVEAALETLEESFALLAESAEVLPKWRQISSVHQVRGKQVYDARLAAVMLLYGISHILTFNHTDFVRYKGMGVEALHPAELAKITH